MSKYDKIRAAIAKKYTGKEKENLVEELDRLYHDALLLYALDTNGVINWEWYDKAVSDCEKWREEYDDGEWRGMI